MTFLAQKFIVTARNLIRIFFVRDFIKNLTFDKISMTFMYAIFILKRVYIILC